MFLVKTKLCLTNVELAWYCRLIKACGLFFLAARQNQQVDSALAGCVSSLVTTVVVVVVNESLDSKEQVRAVFLRPDVNVLIFYRFPKSFYPDVVFCAAAAVHTDLAFRGNQSFAGISIPNCLDTRLANIRAGECKARFISAERRRMKPKVNPVASPDRLSCVDICPSVSQDAASSIFGVSNAAAEFSRNSFFQRLHHYW